MMKDPILHAVTRERTSVTPVEASAPPDPLMMEMDIAREPNLPSLHFTDTEKLMDDMSLTEVILLSKFNSYSKDGYDSREAERDICLFAEEYFKQTSTVFLLD